MKGGNIFTLLPKVAFEKSKLLTPAQYEELLLANNLKAFMGRLKKLNYKGMEIKEKVPLHFIEYQLKENMFESFYKLIRAASTKHRKFFLSYLVKYELENVKILFRTIEKDAEAREWELHFEIEEILGRSELWEEAVNAGDLDSLFSIFQHLPYFTIIKDAYNVMQQKKFSYFYLDLYLDLYYFDILWNAHKKLSRKDKKITEKIIGFQTDFFNFETIIRAKTLQLSDQFIVKMLTHSYYKLKKESLEDLISGESNIDNLLRFFHAKMEGTPLKLGEPSSVEHIYKEQLSKLIQSLYLKAGFNIGRPFAFFLNKELEIENLRTISIGIYYKKPADEIRKLLYFPIIT
ncbi:MAG: V0D/AC39 family V-type ATPase subunit [Candidatus Helarchaeota archaeon]